MTDVSSPAELMQSIEQGARHLDAGGRKLAKAIRDQADLERDYEKALQEALITLFHEAKESGERLPAEDIRRALAHRAVPSGVYGRFLSGRAQVDALKAWTRTLEASLNARQSLLRVLRVELEANVSPQQPQWSGRQAA